MEMMAFSLDALQTISWSQAIWLIVLAFTPSWFFLLNAYRHCKKYNVAFTPWVGRILLLPGEGLGHLYADIPQRPEAERNAIYNRIRWMLHGFTVLYLGAAIVLIFA